MIQWTCSDVATLVRRAKRKQAEYKCVRVHSARIRTLVRNTSELRPKVSGFPHRFGTFRTPFTYDTCTSVGGIHQSLHCGRDIATLIVVLATLRNDALFCNPTPLEEVHILFERTTLEADKAFYLTCLYIIWNIHIKRYKCTNPPHEMYHNCNTT